jgi:phosphatidyl-myo-inositol alpha-mannosyltransferase
MVFFRGAPREAEVSAPPLHVALVTEFYYPHLGGVTEHVHFLRRELVARGHRVTIVTSHMKPAVEDGPGVVRVGTSRVLPSNGSLARITTGWGLSRRLESVFTERGIDLVHVHGGLAPTFGILAPRAAERVGIPCVATFHSWFRRSVGYECYRHFFRRESARLKARIAVSEPVVRAMHRYFHDEWEIVPNGVDTTSFHPNGRRPADALRDGRPRLLFLGRLDPRNGLGTVLKAMPRILEHFPGAQLTVAGDGPLRPLYERQAARFGDRVRLVGRIYDERPEHYGTSDLYLCPTDKASFGITLLEAMACGTPLVVSDIVGFRELVAGGKEAVLVAADDPDAWSQVVIDLLKDPERRAVMGAAGRAKAESYSWPEVAERILAIYRRALA